MIKTLCVLIACFMLCGCGSFSKHTRLEVKAKKFSMKLKSFAPPIEAENVNFSLDRTVAWSTAKDNNV